MELKLRTLSPVHIGSGKEIEPFDYVARDGTYSRVAFDAFADRLYEMDAESPERLSAWITETADRIADLDDQRGRAGREGGREINQQLRNLRRRFTLDHFAWDVLRVPELASALMSDETLAHYRCPIGTDEQYRMKEQTKTADWQPYVPGSSLKGALRTALAYQVLVEADEALKREILNGVPGTDIRGLGGIPDQARAMRQRRDSRELKRLQENVGQEIEKLIFRCGAENQRRRIVSYKEIHFDLMRSVSVSDTYSPSASFFVLLTYTFLRQFDRSDPGAAPRLSPQTPVLLEALAPNSVFDLRVDVDLNFVRQAADRTKPGEWIGLAQRFTRLFGFPIRDLASLQRGDVEKRMIDRILQASRAFSAAIAAEEVRWAEQFSRNETGRLLDFYQGLVNRGESHTPVRLGWGSHFMSTTLMLALRGDPVLGEVMEDLVRAFEIDLIRSQRSRAGDPRTRRVNLQTFPRSRRLAAAGRNAAAPFGWMEISAPDAETSPALVEAADLLVRPERRPSRGRGRSPQAPATDFEPRDSTRDTISISEIKKALQTTQAQPDRAVKEGMRVSAEVVSNNGRTVVIRLVGAQDEELSIIRPAFPHRAGARIKVRVQRVVEGRVTQVVP